jgi:hypothetical protein
MTETSLVKAAPANLARAEEYRPLSLATGKSRLPTKEEWDQIAQFATFAWKSGVAESMGLANEAQVVIVSMKGWELGLPPMTSLENIRIIKGRPQPSAALMESLAVARVPGARVDWIDLGENGSATCIAHRKGRHPIKITYTEADAKRARVNEKETYQRHPAQLFRAGALRQACWLQYKEVYMGFEINPADLVIAETDEELDVSEPPTPPANGAAAAPAAPSAPAPTPPATAPAATPPAATAPATPPSSAAPNVGAAPSTPGTPMSTDQPGVGAQASAGTAEAPRAPEDGDLPYTKGEFAGKKLSDLKGEDFRKIIHGYERVIRRADPTNEAGIKANKDWQAKVQAWADHRGVKVPPMQGA